MDNIIQEITRQVFRVVGRAVLSQGLGGGGSDDSGDGSRGSVSVSLPTFPPDEDEDEDEEEEDTVHDKSTSTTTTLRPAVKHYIRQTLRAFGKSRVGSKSLG